MHCRGRPLVVALAVTMLSACATPAATPPQPRVDLTRGGIIDTAEAALAWMAGCWEARSGALLVEEQWLPPRAGVLLGVSRTSRQDSVVAWEFMRIFARGDTLVFEAHPSGQAKTEFHAPSHPGRRVVFENDSHDFPQRVIYRAVRGDSLLARIEGTRGGTARAVDFPYARVPCSGAASGR